MTFPVVRARSTRTVVLAAILLAMFAVLGLVAHHARSGTALDHTVLDAMIAHRSPALTRWALAGTTLFSPAGTGVLAVVAAAVLWWRLGSPRPAMLVLAALAGAGAASTLTKIVVGAHRPPPAVQLIAETDGSFPSGHVTGTVALLGALAVVAGRYCRRSVRVASWIVTASAAVAVGFTRLYLGVHWASDVVGGLLLGATAVAVTHLAAARRMIEPAGGSGSSAEEAAVPSRAA